MKSIIGALVVVGMLAFHQQRAFSKSDPMHQEIVLAQEQKVEIQQDELPDAAQGILKSDEYADWTVLHCYKVMDGDFLVEYEVNLDSDGIAQVLKFDLEGNLKTLPGT